jgi:hypothetical protein
MRFLATLPDRLATVDDDGVQLHQYADGTLRASVAGETVGLRMTTRYPWSGEVDIEVTETTPRPWRLSLRSPAWCADATVSAADQPTERRSGPGSFVIERAWSVGDRVTLELAMEPRITSPDPRIDALRHTVALERGPLVYAVEDADLPRGASVEAMEVDADLDVEAIMGAVPGVQDGVRLSFEARLRDDSAAPGWPYPTRSAGKPVQETPPVSIVSVEAVPYFAWGERTGLGMRVWLPLASGPADPKRDGHGH